jgi:NADH:ubiquinone oxidoreductase subunit 5 (subunit L)/multisubunit Na+/H+ antiporter MnhA subunit
LGEAVVGRSSLANSIEKQMRFERKIGLVLACIIFPYMCAVFALVFYVQAHPGPVPRWISLSMLCGMVLTLIVGGILISRFAKKEAARQTEEEARLRRTRASRGLKVGLIVYIVILLNGIRLVLQQTIPLVYAIPGLTVVSVLFVTSWASLQRLKKAEANAKASGQNQAPLR